MIIDSHVHFNLKANNPYDDLKCNLKNSNIDKSVLIVNNENEYQILKDNSKRLISDGFIGAIASIVDPHKPSPLDLIERCTGYGLPMAIKIHPRISDITRNDFLILLDNLGKVDVKTIIVDSFIYGPKLESHIGCDLAVCLAESFKDKKIVLAHAGGCEMLKTLLVTRPLANIFYDFSLSCNYLMRTSVEPDMIHGLRLWKKRIMFGTDYPDFSFEQALSATKYLCEKAELNSTEEEMVFSKNAIDIYNIEA